MKQTTEIYKAAVAASPRRVVPIAQMDFSDPDAQYGTLRSAPLLPFCSAGQLVNHKILVEKPIATLENNLWLLNGEYYLPERGRQEDAETGLVFDVQCDDEGVFDDDTFVELPISEVQVLQALTLVFEEDPQRGWPVEYTVELKVGSSAVWSRNVTDGAAGRVIFEGFTIYDPTAVRIVFKKWSVPRRRPGIVEIAPGIFEEWTGADLYELDVIQQTDFTNLTVSYDTARVVLRNETRRFYPRAEGSIFASIEARQPISVYYGVCQPGDKPERVPAGVFYLKEQGWETAATDSSFEMNFVSIVGLLAERVPQLPETLPETVAGWLELLLLAIGSNFVDKYTVPEDVAAMAMTATAEDVQGLNCGNLLRYICMAAGAYYSADPVTGYLSIKKLEQEEGKYISLSEQFAYPVESEDQSWADIAFMLADDEIYTVGGNVNSLEKTCKVNNPFVKTKAAAQAAARNILTVSGGSVFKIAGRGDPACDIGDIDTFETIFGERVTARRKKQQLKFTNGVMLETPSWHMQAGWQSDYAQRLEFAESGSWTVPEGVSKIRLVLIGRGEDGEDGSGSSWSADGEPGSGGAGGEVWVGDVGVNPGGSYSINIGENSTFGTAYSSADGRRYDGGWGDIYTGKVYAAAGDVGPQRCKRQTAGADGEPGTGNGGQGGGGGRQGARAWDGDKWVYKRNRVAGGQGGTGATGCVIIYVSD